MIYAYTDGSSRGNPGNGGYGIVLLDPISKKLKEISQGYKKTTNNRMELLAVIVALESLKRHPIDITIYTDSKYVCDSINKKWVFNWEKNNFAGKKNPDLWKRFLTINKKHNLTIEWVKGHAGNKWNERADILATKAADSDMLLTDHFFENIPTS